MKLQTSLNQKLLHEIFLGEGYFTIGDIKYTIILKSSGSYYLISETF